MKKSTWEDIYIYIKKKQPATITGIADFSGLSRVRVHAIMNHLLAQGMIYKVGSTPKVEYYATGGVELDMEYGTNNLIFTLRNNGKVLTTTSVVANNSLYKLLQGLSHSIAKNMESEFIERQRKVKPNHLFNMIAKTYIRSEKTAYKRFEQYMNDNFGLGKEYEYSNSFYGVFFTLDQHVINKNGWLDASIKLHSLEPLYKECGEEIHLKNIFYAGLDKIDAHKTINYEKMELIKEFQDITLIEQYCDMIFGTDFQNFVVKEKIDALLVVPNNVKRQISFNEHITDHLKQLYSYPQILVDTNIFVGRKPQNKISGICKRIENAEKLFAVDKSTTDKSFKKILIIDDVLGSGATVNTIAKKIHVLLPDADCIGFALLGSYRRGFDVVTGI